MAIVSTDRPLTSARCGEVIKKLVRTYPGLRSGTLTETAFGRPVQSLVLGSGPRQVIFSGAHHGNEWITALVLLKFAEDLAHAEGEEGQILGISAGELTGAATIHLVPMVDPDGVDLVTGAIPETSPEYASAREIASRYPDIPFPDGWKANLLGVDLNLQYPAGWLRAREIKFSQGYTRPAPRDYVGRAPLTQREALALAQYTEDVDPDLILALHTQGQVIYWQFEDYAVPGAEELAERFSQGSGYALEAAPEESAYAGYKDWFIQTFRRPGFTIEAGEGENPLPLAQFDSIYQSLLGILTTAALG